MPASIHERQLTKEFLLSLFTYDPSEGKLYWKISPNKKIKIGQEAGGFDGHGYRRVWFLGRNYRIHRIIWFLEKGTWPTETIDHNDRNKKNNRIGNLSDIPAKYQSWNRSSQTDASSSYIGVYKKNGLKNKPWGATIRLGKKTHHIAYYKTEFDAAIARDDYAMQQYKDGHIPVAPALNFPYRYKF